MAEKAPNMKALRIKDWDALYESSESRKRQDLHWVKMPNSHDGLGYRKLIAGRNGGGLFGAWCAIVQVASRRPKGLRGCLVGDDGTPMTTADLALMTGLPAELFDQCIKKALSGAVGWLEEIESAARPADDAGAPASDAARPVLSIREEKREEEKRDICEGGKDDAPPDVMAAVAAMERWSLNARGYGLKPANNELRWVEDTAEAMRDRPPVIRRGEAVPSLLLFPEAVEMLMERGAPFNGVKYALACVQSELEAWRLRGAPGGGPGRSASATERAAAAVARMANPSEQREAS